MSHEANPTLTLMICLTQYKTLAWPLINPLLTSRGIKKYGWQRLKQWRSVKRSLLLCTGWVKLSVRRKAIINKALG